MVAGALAVVLLLGSIGVEAAPASRKVQARPAELFMKPDEAFTLARQYASQDSLERFEQVAGKVGDHPLATYIDYWRLKLRLSEARAEPALSLVDADVRKYLDAQPHSLTSDLLRRDWMLSLARRRDWPTLAGIYQHWVLRDESQVHCYGLLAQGQRGDSITASARELLMQTRELGEGCTALLEFLFRQGQFKRDDVWRRLLISLENNSPQGVRRAAAVLGLDADKTDAALNRPARAATQRTDREYDVIWLSRLARNEPRQAAERIESLNLKPADKAFAWSQIAAAGMRKLDPESLAWTRESLKAQVSDETLTWLARAALRGADWKTLGTVIEKMSPDGKRDPTWVYWLARSRKALGHPQEAEQILRSIAGQFHFYGQLAAEDLGELTLPPPRPPGPTPEELAETSGNEGFARALKFYELGMRMEGNREWNFQLRGMSDRQLLAAAEYARRNSILDRAVNTADRTVSEHDFALRFVSPFNEQLDPMAREMGLDPAWVYGLIRQESRFIMDARSSAGAQGLMQLMPATARWVARKMGVVDFRQNQLSETATNIKFGTYYLKSVFDDLEGSSLLASAAYNAGPNRPRTWRSTLPAQVEGAVFAEIIPFTETRDYVKKVLSNSTYYAAIFTGQPQSLRQRLGMVAPRTLVTSDLP